VFQTCDILSDKRNTHRLNAPSCGPFVSEPAQAVDIAMLLHSPGGVDFLGEIEHLRVELLPRLNMRVELSRGLTEEWAKQKGTPMQW
jgi:hypothetical protein